MDRFYRWALSIIPDRLIVAEAKRIRRRLRRVA